MLIFSTPVENNIVYIIRKREKRLMISEVQSGQQVK